MSLTTPGGAFMVVFGILFLQCTYHKGASAWVPPSQSPVTHTSSAAKKLHHVQSSSRCNEGTRRSRTSRIGVIVTSERRHPETQSPPVNRQRNQHPFLPSSIASFFMSASLFCVATTWTGSTPFSTPSSCWALTEAQMLVNDVWTTVTKQYYDPTFHGMGEEGWRQKRLQAVTKAGQLDPFPLAYSSSSIGQQMNEIGDDEDREEQEQQKQVYAIIRTMLSYLEDPYTRFLSPPQYRALTNYAKGTTTNNSKNNGGIGIQLGIDPQSKQVMVTTTVSNGPADQAGIKAGDILVQIDGMTMDGASPEVAAATCRGAPGSLVSVTTQSSSSASPKRWRVTRAVLQPSRVESTVLRVDDIDQEASRGGGVVGVVRIPSFTLDTEQQVREALSKIKTAEQSKLSAVVLDLRGNVGGYMPAGVNIAKLFLSPQARVISEIDKNARATIYINDGVGSETKIPLFVLVDKKTASASEILAAALQDNHRAQIVGNSPTFGKGRIQNIQELQFGSGVAVTKAKYITPNGKDIQGKGITPDIKSTVCGSVDSVSSCMKGVL